ncbi:hypothetical protein ACIQXZ_24965 [Bacillus thuringiensis]
MQRNISIVEDEDILLKIVKNYLLDDGYLRHKLEKKANHIVTVVRAG